MKTKEKVCPCGSNQRLKECCAPIISGETKADTAEQLMRSRYTAYNLGFADYIQQSWHSSTRPETLKLDNNTHWTSLKIISASKVTIRNQQQQARVEFVASYRINGICEKMHEVSRFILERGSWWYVDGEQLSTPSRDRVPGRNSPCFCGSGKKYKKCCY